MTESIVPLLSAALANESDPSAREVLIHRIGIAAMGDAIRVCSQCSLSSATTPVPGVFPSSLPLVMIGEAPGRFEEETGIPFVGAAGGLVDRVLSKAGVQRSDVAAMNVICCRPPGNNFDTAVSVGAVDACSNWFTAQLERSDAWVVLAFGNHAIAQFTDESPHKVRGKPFWHRGRLIIPTWHPAYCLRRAEALPDLHEAVALAVKFATAKLEAPEFATWSPDEWLASIGWQRPNAQEEKKFRVWWRRKGYVPVHSALLGEDVVVVHDMSVKVDERYADRVKWTVAELAKLKAWSSKTAEDVMRVQMVKRELGGEWLT